MGFFDFLGKKQDFTNSKYPELNNILIELNHQNLGKRKNAFKDLIKYRFKSEEELKKRTETMLANREIGGMMTVMQSASVMTQLSSMCDRDFIILDQIEKIVQQNDALKNDAEELKNVIIVDLLPRLEKLGTVYKELKKYDECLIYYNKVLGIDPCNWKLLNTKGEIFYLQGKYEDALDCLNSALINNPESVEVKINRAKTIEALQNRNK